MSSFACRSPWCGGFCFRLLTARALFEVSSWTPGGVVGWVGSSGLVVAQAGCVQTMSKPAAALGNLKSAANPLKQPCLSCGTRSRREFSTCAGSCAAGTPRRAVSSRRRTSTLRCARPKSAARALEPFEIPLEEGDVKQDGVVLRGEGGAGKAARLPGRCGLPVRGACIAAWWSSGAQAMLQLEPFSAEQMQELLEEGIECKVLAVTKKAVVEARLNPDGKVRDVAANRIISAASILALVQTRRLPACQGRDPGAL